MSDVCPKCGAGELRGSLPGDYECGSYRGAEFRQSADCKLAIANRDLDEAVRLLRIAFAFSAVHMPLKSAAEIREFLGRYLAAKGQANPCHDT